MRTRVRLAALVVTCGAMLSLTGAGATAQTPPQPPAIGPLVTRAGCSLTGLVDQTKYGAREVSACGLGGYEFAVIATFDDAEGMARWLGYSRPLPGTCVIGSGWAVLTTGPDVAATLAGRLGGVIR